MNRPVNSSTDDFFDMPTRDSSPPSPHSNHHQTNKRPPTTMTKPRRPHRSITTSSSSSSSRHTSPEDGRRSRQSGTINKAKITEQQQRRSKPSNHRKHSSSSSSLERPPPEETDPKPLSEVRITAKPPMYRLNKDPSDNDDENDTSSESGTKVGGGDITDISPMQTPHYRNKSQNNSKTFELNSMMNVLLGSQNESESRPQTSGHYSTPVHTPTSVSAKKKRVRLHFSDEQILSTIDQENKRLLRQLINVSNRNQQQPFIGGSTNQRVRVTSSALNRQKEQQRIEKENMKILNRLQQTRATKSLNRDELLSYYDRQIGYVSVGNTPSGKSTPIQTGPSSRSSSRPSSASIFYSRVKSAHQLPPSSANNPTLNSFIQTRATSSTSNLTSAAGSRPNSATRPLSGHRHSRSSSRASSARRKPTWNDRWQHE